MTEPRSAFAKDLDWLDGFYAAAGYGGAVQPYDRVFFSADGNDILGVVRLAAESGTIVLRGMQIAEKYRGRRVGSALLKYLTAELREARCFCLPYSHLEAFYAAEGFRTAKDSELPQFLVERRQSYLNRGMKVIAMVRPSAAPGF